MTTYPMHLRIALKIMPVVLGMALIAGLHTIERVFFPVVENFHVTSMRQYKDRVVLRGYMKKTRDCAFAGVSVYGDTGEGKTPLTMLYMEQLNDGHNTSRPQGMQAWGPWRVSIPVAPDVTSITMTAVHDCHFAWASKTKLTTFPVIHRKDREE